MGNAEILQSRRRRVFFRLPAISDAPRYLLPLDQFAHPPLGADAALPSYMAQPALREQRPNQSMTYTTIIPKQTTPRIVHHARRKAPGSDSLTSMLVAIAYPSVGPHGVLTMPTIYLLLLLSIGALAVYLLYEAGKLTPRRRKRLTESKGVSTVTRTMVPTTQADMAPLDYDQTAKDGTSRDRPVEKPADPIVKG